MGSGVDTGLTGREKDRERPPPAGDGRGRGPGPRCLSPATPGRERPLQEGVGEGNLGRE